MASHSSLSNNQIFKTFSFKVKSSNLSKDFFDVIKEYQEYYNKCSDVILENLTCIKIGDIFAKIPEKSKKSDYAQYAISDEWKNVPLYNIFSKAFAPMHRDNLLYIWLTKLVPYKGNLLEISDTFYKRNGFIKSVISNYTTSFTNIKPKVKFQKLTGDDSHEILLTQTICDMVKFNLYDIKSWEEMVSYFEMKSETSEDTLNRIHTLFDFYKNNTPEVEDKYNELVTESLNKFGGCRRDMSKLTMSIQLRKKNIKVTHSSNTLNYKYGKLIDLELWGRKDIINNDELLINLDNVCEMIVFKIKNGEIYVDIPFKVDFIKKDQTIDKIAGVDANIKHMLLSTSVKDENLIGYTNIYKEVINDSDFQKVCDNKTMKILQEISNYVTFAPIEFDMLFSRISKQREMKDKYINMEIAFTNVLNKLKQKFIVNSDNKNRIYIESILKLRSQLKSYAILEEVKYKKASEYDSAIVEEFGVEYLETHPFKDTETYKEINKKILNISENIIGCRNNIIQYAYKIFESNGFDMISLENLTNSNFKKEKNMPTIKSLLSYHHVLGKTNEEIEKLDVYSVIKKGYYTFEYKDGKVVNAKLSEIGEMSKIKTTMFNMMIKSIHFAEIKDYFITLANNGEVGVSLVPSYYTSQMDSTDHKVFGLLSKKGKWTLVDKRKVRKNQETHINGLNADYNAAKNIAFILSDEVWRNKFTKKTKTPKYNTPSYYTSINSQGKMLRALKSLKAFKEFKI